MLNQTTHEVGTVIGQERKLLCKEVEEQAQDSKVIQC